jgi:two-component system, OmpR family, sensor histidine kinase CiaH
MFERVRLRLTILYALFLGVTILLLGAALYFVTRFAFDDEINDSLRESRSELAALSTDELRATLGLGAQAADDPILATEEIEDEDGDDDLEEPASLEPGIFLVLTTLEGRVVANPLRVELEGIDFPDLIEDLEEGERIDEVSGDEGSFRFDTSFLAGDRLETEDDFYLHVGRSLSARNEQLDRLLLIVLGGAVLGIVLSILGGLVLAGRALIPVRDAYDKQTRFVADASHELRTPLAVIQANNEVLLRHRDQTIDENVEHSEAIEAESEHMNRLVGQLLTLARADEGQLALAQERFDLAQLLEELAREVSPLFESKGLALQLQLESAPVVADEGRIRQVAMILLDNALNHTPSGGTVTVSSGSAGRGARFAVADTGPGIPADEQERVFERFYRLDPARTREQGGTGLGLAIARTIVEAHGGRVTLASQPGSGSTFTVRLPR